MVPCCWVNLQRRGVLLILIRVGRGPTALAVGAGCFFTLFCHFSLLSDSLWETARYRLPQKAVKHIKQPTNQNRSISGRLPERGRDGAMVLCKLPVPGRPTN